MTNLSDLLPAGAASKQLNFTADGAIASGQTVALQTAGTVKAVSGIAEAVGTETNYTTNNTSYTQCVFDPDTGKTIIAYQDHAGISDKGMVVVATPTASGTISLGTPVEFATTASYIGMSYDTGQDKVLLTYRGGSNHCKARVGTVSGTSISFGTELTVESATCAHTSVAYSPDLGSHLVAYDYDTASGRTKVLTVSGTNVTAGSSTTFGSSSVSQTSVAYDESADKYVLSYRDHGNSYYGTAVVVTVSGTTPSLGSAVVFESANSIEMDNTYDSSAQKVVITYRDLGNSNRPTAIVGTVSGTSISFGSAVVIASVETTVYEAAYDSINKKVVVTYRDEDATPEDNGAYAVGTVSGTSISFATPAVFNSGVTTMSGIAFDTTLGKFVIAYNDYRGSSSNTPYGTAVTLQLASTNSASFLGIADEAISNAASGKITMKGGVATNSQLLPLAYTGSLGSAAVYESAQAEYQGMAFDSSNNRVVVAYKDDGNSSHGTAAVGTVSGTGITWGTPVVFEAASTSYVAVTFDSSNNKIVIAYSDVGNSEHGTAIVGTVSGTSISFGSPVVFAAAATTLIDATFDSNLNKVVISYRDGGNSSYGTAIVGTVSGTSISFGTEVVFNSGGSTSPTVTFDSSNNKVVVCYKTIPNNGNSKVGTVSGTSISFGSEANFSNNATIDNGLDVTFDSNSNKVVVAYEDTANSNYITAAVGTVSGTSISFGTPVVIDTTGNVSYPNISFDSNSNVVVAAYSISGTPAGRYAIGSVSGTSVSFETPVTFNTNYSNYVAITFDSSQNTTVIAYRDGGNSNYGTAKGLQITSGYPNLVPNTTYYVQDDGTLSTTSSSVTAGKAMSTNSINLDYST